MASLLKKGNYEFPHILSDGYSVIENVNDVLAEYTMGNGAIRRNYGAMPKTQIKVKFGRMGYYDMASILEKLGADNWEGDYTYWSPKRNQYLTAKFFVTPPEIPIVYTNYADYEYEEIEVELNQCDYGG